MITITYAKVIQQNYAGYWEDVSEYETDSSFLFKNKEDRALFKHDIAEYRIQHGATRSINRRTKIGGAK